MSRLRRAMPWLYEGVYGKGDREQHLLAVRHLEKQRETAFEHEYLYSCLTVLDIKSSALMAFDAILLAASSIALSSGDQRVTAGDVLVIIALVISGFSSSLCLLVVWIFWTETTDLEHDGDVFVKLLKVRDTRTVAYRLSWLAAQLAALTLVIGVVLGRLL